MTSVHVTSNYASELFNFLKEVESLDKINGDLRPYYDTKMLVTIGVGFNIEGPAQEDLLRAVLKQFGLDPLDASLTDTQRTAEQTWYNAINKKRGQVFPLASPPAQC
jgi:hypothetical protein